MSNHAAPQKKIRVQIDIKANEALIYNNVTVAVKWF